MDEELRAMRDLGRTAAEKLAANAQQNQASGMSRSYWNVSSLNSGGTANLTRGDGGTAQSKAGVPYTTACVGIAVGSRVIVDTFAHRSVITGVLAGASYDLPTVVQRTSTGYTIGSAGAARWWKLGTWTSGGDSTSIDIELYSGNGYNGTTSQNSVIRIYIKDGYQSTKSTTTAMGCTVTLDQATSSDVTVQVRCTAHNVCEVWAYLSWSYPSGRYFVRGAGTWVHSGSNQSSTPTTGTAQNVAIIPGGFTVGTGLSFSGGTLGVSAPTTLFSNSSGSEVTSITLSQSIASFRFVAVWYSGNNNGGYPSCELMYVNYGSTAACTLNNNVYLSSNVITQFNVGRLSISGTALTVSNRRYVNITDSGTVGTGTAIFKIYRVLGWG